jgi:hypothetical protein
MLTRPSQLAAYVDALKVLIRGGDTNRIDRAEEIIKRVVTHEPALKGKTDVLNALRGGIEPERKVASGESHGYAETVLELIAKMLREFQP